jgi:hypothetical protein
VLTCVAAGYLGYKFSCVFRTSAVDKKSEQS